jgi:hypothetical protein
MIGLLLFSILADTPKAEAPQPPLIRLAPQADGKPPSALHYRLLPDSTELTGGNAALLWYESALLQRGVAHKITQEEYEWAESTLPLQKLPQAKVKALLNRYAAALKQSHRAARRESCDWQQPPLTWQSIGELQPQIQIFRELALLLNIQCRLRLSERQFDDAAYTLRTGLTLARHLGRGNTLIENLVGIAIAETMLYRVEEWMQIPGSPNLYWPLAALPNPLVEVRRALGQELDIVYRSFPELRELRNKKLSPSEVDAVFANLFRYLNLFGGYQRRKDRPFLQKMGIALMTAKKYPEARQSLLDKGWAKKNVDDLLMTQVVLIGQLDDFDRLREDIQKSLSLPAWQALPELTRVQNEARAAPEMRGNVFALSLAAFDKIFNARVRLDRHIAILRCGEALRAHASVHEGQPPAKWSDITSVPLPADPVMGKGFDALYEIKDGRGLLNVPGMPGQGLLTGRRLEWSK